MSVPIGASIGDRYERCAVTGYVAFGDMLLD